MGIYLLFALIFAICIGIAQKWIRFHGHSAWNSIQRLLLFSFSFVIPWNNSSISFKNIFTRFLLENHCPSLICHFYSHLFLLLLFLLRKLVWLRDSMGKVWTFSSFYFFQDTIPLFLLLSPLLPLSLFFCLSLHIFIINNSSLLLISWLYLSLLPSTMCSLFFSHE